MEFELRIGRVLLRRPGYVTLRPAAEQIRWRATADRLYRQAVPLRPATLISTGVGLSRAEVKKRIAAGLLCSQRRLTGRCAQDFGFVFRWQ